MIEAIKKNDPYKVEVQLKYVKPQENLMSEGENETCLHFAAQNNSYQVIPILLDHIKANNQNDLEGICKIQNIRFNTPIMEAASTDSIQAFEILFDQGANDVSVKDKDGNTLETICKKNSYKCYEYMTGGNKNAGKSKKEIEEEERQKEEEERQKYEEEKRKKEEAEHKKKMEELEKKKQELQEEEERKKLEAEIQRQKEEEEKRRKEEEEKARQEALKRKQEEEERKRKQEEEERKKKEAEEQAKQSSWLSGIPPDSKTYQKL